MDGPSWPEASYKVVLDTNTVLDWLVFDDSSCRTLSGQISAGRLRWQATLPMRDELAHVLPRPDFARWKPHIEGVLALFDYHVTLVDDKILAVAPPALSCKDPDDQKFIDLALAIGARWLFTRDRALLDLARPARALGLDVVKPTDWQFALGSTHDQPQSCALSALVKG